MLRRKMRLALTVRAYEAPTVIAMAIASALGERLFEALTGGLEATAEQVARLPNARALWRVSSRTIAEIECGLRVDRFCRGLDHPSLKSKTTP
jgi:hypothetical protein